MKIGLATDFYLPWIGGPSILLKNLSQGLAERGHEVHLLAPSALGPAGEETDGLVHVTRVPTVPSPFGFNLRVAPFAGRHVGRWLDRVSPDIVHVHHPFPISASTVLRASRRGIPVAMTNHTIPECSLWGMRSTGPLYGLLDRGLGGWIAFLLNRCGAVATPTRTAAAALPRLGYRGEANVISNGIDTARFSPAPASEALRSQLGLDARPIVLYTGRLDAEKQMDIWLRAAAQLGDLNAQFVVGGKGTDRQRLERLASELGLGARVCFIGYVSDRDLPDLYRLASVYFITSPVELQSITTLEAVSSGLPVVAADALALPELVQDGWNGKLFPAGDADAAARALRAVLIDENSWPAMGERSRATALRHDLCVSLDLYERFLTDASLHAGRARHVGRAPAAG